jgi:hypothetical protein
MALALMDVDVARDRAAVSLNNANPFSAAHFTEVSLSYPNHPKENDDVDDEGEIDLSVSLDVDIDVDAALDADDGCGHDVEAVFEDDTGKDDSSDDDVDDADDADPLHPFHPGTFSGNDTAVETNRLYGDVMKYPKRSIISQGGVADAFHVDYEELSCLLRKFEMFAILPYKPGDPFITVNLVYRHILD